MWQVIVASAVITTNAVGVTRVDVPAARERLTAALSCCSELAAAPVRPLPDPKKRVMLDETAPAFEFLDGGKSYFHTYELPTETRPYRVTVSSFTASWKGKVAAFLPVVMLLDAQRQPLEVSSPGEIVYLRASGWSDPPSFRVERTIPLNSPARYLVVKTTTGLMEEGRWAHVSTPGTMMSAGKVFVPLPGLEGDLNFIGSPVGSLKIRLTPLKAH